MAGKRKPSPKRKLPDEVPPLIGTFKDEGGVTRFYRKPESADEYRARCEAYKRKNDAAARLQRLNVNGWKQDEDGKWVM